MCKIRIAVEQDAEALSLLLHQLRHPFSAKEIRDQLEKINAEGALTVLVAEADNEVCGVLALQISLQLHEKAMLARIVDLCVRDTRRGKGVGRKLVAAAEILAREKNCRKLEVTANNFREPAHRFYQQSGMISTHRYFAKPL